MQIAAERAGGFFDLVDAGIMVEVEQTIEDPAVLDEVGEALRQHASRA